MFSTDATATATAAGNGRLNAAPSALGGGRYHPNSGAELAAVGGDTAKGEGEDDDGELHVDVDDVEGGEGSERGSGEDNDEDDGDSDDNEEDDSDEGEGIAGTMTKIGKRLKQTGRELGRGVRTYSQAQQQLTDMLARVPLPTVTVPIPSVAAVTTVPVSSQLPPVRRSITAAFMMNPARNILHPRTATTATATATDTNTAKADT
jgi:hypothetical protein